MSAVLRGLIRFARAERGATAVEFALVAPVLITLFLGSAVSTQLLNADRKVTLATSVIADLVAQDDFLTDDDLAEVYAAGEAVLFPLEAEPLAVRITSIRMEADEDIVRDWSVGRGGLTAYTGNDMPDLPDGLLSPLSSVVIVETSYRYEDVMAVGTDAWTLGDTAYMRPRRAPWVRRP